MTPGSVVAPTTPDTGSPAATGAAGALAGAGLAGVVAPSATGAAATPSILTGPAVPPVDASKVCVTTVLIETTVGVGAGVGATADLIRVPLFQTNPFLVLIHLKLLFL